MKKYTITTRLYFSVIVTVLLLTLYGGSSRAGQYFTASVENQSKKKVKTTVDMDTWKAKQNRVKIALRDKESPTVLGITNQKAKSIPILLYHGITEDKGNQAGIQKDSFVEHMYALKNNGWNTTSTEDLYLFLQGQKELPSKSFLLTFDDGRKDSYYYADPVLNALDFKAVMFTITSGDWKSTYYLDEEEYEEMLAGDNWEIQSHGHKAQSEIIIDKDGNTGHYLANKMWIDSADRLETDEEYRQRITNDLKNSKYELQNRLGIEINGFAFPFGDFGQKDTNYYDARKVLEAITRDLFELTFYQPWKDSEVRNYPNEDTFMIKRIGVEPDLTSDELFALLEQSEDKNLDYQDSLVSNKGWIQSWGNLVFDHGYFTLLTSDTNSAGT